MFPFDPPKTSENQRFSDAFRGIKKEPWVEKGLTCFLSTFVRLEKDKLEIYHKG